DLERHVFGASGARRPVAWEVINIGETLTLGGPPLPGYVTGSELRIYAGTAEGSDTQDPGKARATVIIEDITGLTATARVSAAHTGMPAPEPGDIAVLVRPGDGYTRITVRLRPTGEPDGIPTERAASIRKTVEENPEANMLTELTGGPGDFELSIGHDGNMLLKGPENTTRIIYENDDVIAKNLWQHARQRALLQLNGEGGKDFTDNHSLQLQLVPVKVQHACADGEWVQAAPNEEQIIPLCHQFNIQVTLHEDTNLGMLDHNTPAGVQIGGVILSTDGSIFGFPVDGRTVRVAPGETATFDLQGETFRGIPPLDVQDRIIVFGTHEANPVPWHRLTQTAKTRSGVIESQNALFRALDKYLQPGTRGIAQETVTDDTGVESDTWTLSSITMRVEANARFLAATSGKPSNKREYTINDFDIRPYLPDDRSSALYKVLKQAHWLTTSSVDRDGYEYKQHDWSLPSDEANLEKGIDCSRAIWFAFTRAGLPYNTGDRYLSTAMMTGNSTRMPDEFVRCDNDARYRIGDILVYRDEEREKPDGHVVMVIDPDKRIAWGSHGWDGNEGDRGVEYQEIKKKQDWKRWDRRTMYRKACWRHKQLIADARTTRGLPGIRGLAEACSATRQCGLTP
ncbi:MAG: caspase family protein, partial [Pseudomonadota bacterium]